jgi:PAS domain S-box-containing protein
MNSSPLSNQSELLCRSFPLWLRSCSIVTLVSSIGLFSLSLFAYNFHPILVASLVPSLLVGLSFAVFLNIYVLWHLRGEQQRADQAFRDTDREFSSIFQNVLDGILIVNNEGDCLDANPAAAANLRISAEKLIGQNIDCLFVDRGESTDKWNSLVQKKKRRGRIELVAGDGLILSVDFAATANYLPGRHVLVLCDVTERTRAELSLKKSEERFRYMADNIQEVFWMLDTETQEVAYVNDAYATLTGHTVESLHNNPSAYRELIHPEDRIRVLSKLQEASISGQFDEEFRLTRADGMIRWVWAKGFSPPAAEETRWLVGTAQDITSRKLAEMTISKHLDVAEAARAEAEALRKATLALSQNLAMDSVLDTLLHCISELVPFNKATVLFVEDGGDLMIAREAPRILPKRIGMTFRTSENRFLQGVLFEKRPLLVPHVAVEGDWRALPPLDNIQSWLGIPLIAADRVLGILSLGSKDPHIFTPEHLRLAKSLAVPAAVAIQNARTHQRAEIYGVELETRLEEMRELQTALEQAIRNSHKSQPQ